MDSDDNGWRPGTPVLVPGPGGEPILTWTLCGGDNVTATAGGITIGPFSIPARMVGYFRADAMRILAAIAACERLQANTRANG